MKGILKNKIKLGKYEKIDILIKGFVRKGKWYPRVALEKQNLINICVPKIDN